MDDGFVKLREVSTFFDETPPTARQRASGRHHHQRRQGLCCDFEATPPSYPWGPMGKSR
jgi:hypothetical protein